MPSAPLRSVLTGIALNAFSDVSRSRPADRLEQTHAKGASFDPYADRGHGDVSATNLRLDRPGAAGDACAVDHRGTTGQCRLIEWADRPQDLTQHLPRPDDLPPDFESPRPISVTFRGALEMLNVPIKGAAMLEYYRLRGARGDFTAFADSSGTWGFNPRPCARGDERCGETASRLG
jgi:hypothetical protein